MKYYVKKDMFIIYNDVIKIGFTNNSDIFSMDHRIIVNFPCKIDNGLLRLKDSIKYISKFSKIEVKLDRNFSKNLKVFGYCDNTKFVLASIVGNNAKVYHNLNDGEIIIPAGYAKWVIPLRHVPIISISGGNKFIRVEVIPPP